MSLIITSSDLAWNPIEGMKRYAKARTAMREGKDKRFAHIEPATMPPGGNWFRIQIRNQTMAMLAEKAKQEEIARKREYERQMESPVPIKLRIVEIVRFVAAVYKISSVDMCSHRRTRDIVEPRQYAMYLSRMYTTRSLPEIGKVMGKRDHTTVLHGVRKVQAKVDAGLVSVASAEVIQAFVETGILPEQI